MKRTLLALFFIIVTIPIARTQTVRQDRLYIDDGAGHFLKIMSSSLGSGRVLTIPDPGGSANIILSASGTGQTIGGGLTINGGDTVYGGMMLGDGLGHTTTIHAGTATGTFTVPTNTSNSGDVVTSDGIGGVSWQPQAGGASPFKFVRKSALQTYSTTSLVNDNDLVIAVSANQTYTIEGYLNFSDPGATGAYPEIAFTSPIGSTLSFGFISAEGLFSANENTIVTTSGTATPRIPIYTNASPTIVHVSGILITGSTASNLQLRAMCAAGSTSFQLNANSYLLLTKVQ
jgi:hypothetical protein